MTLKKSKYKTEHLYFNENHYAINLLKQFLNDSMFFY